ncbi:MAG: GxxExxY protein [Thermodesulfobacteriota bacterium]|nr:GxxExxY protein [Thermodesulfobacteriota bacterium]
MQIIYSADPAEQTAHSLREEIGFAMDINDITYAINGAVLEVNRILGPGFLKKIYENALLIELKGRGLRTESQVPIRVLYKENPVGEYFIDIFVIAQYLWAFTPTPTLPLQGGGRFQMISIN